MNSAKLLLMRFSVAICVGVAVVWLNSACAITREPSPPNILLIMADDLGWGDVGFNGNDNVQTPNLDRMAHNGIIFTRFYSASAVCSPTRASCITGRNPLRMNIPTANAGHLPEEEITLPELLKTKGYRTGHFGKWHLGTLTTKVVDANRGRPRDSTHFSIPTQHGYDQFFCTESKVPTYDPMIKPLLFDTARGESLRYGWAAVTPGVEVLDYGTYYWEGKEVRASANLEGDDARVMMDRVVRFVESSVKEHKPFFATVWFHTPHLPVVANETYRRRYQALDHRKQLLYGAISGMDDQIGRLWQRLSDLEQQSNTMIWFCSDNGPEVRTPGSSGGFRGRKRDLYEGGVRVPAFLIWKQKITGDQVLDMPAVTSDYLPTIIDFLGIDYPDDRPLDGVSLVPALTNRAVERTKPIGFIFRTKTSWVTDRFKLISTDRGERWELYDLIADKTESLDMASTEPQRLTGMKEDLEGWLESVARSSRGEDYSR